MQSQLLYGKLKRLFTVILLLIIPLYSYSQKRIVTLSPALTDIVRELGYLKNIVGVSSFSHIPEEYKKRIKKVGSLDNLNIETIISLNPDIVFGYREHIKTIELLKRRGIRCVILPHLKLNDIFYSILVVGNHLKCKKKAQKLVEKIKKRLFIIRENVKKRKKTLVIIEREPETLKNIYILGKGDFLSELLEISGGINVYDGNSLYPKVSIEFIINSSPDVIIEFSFVGSKKSSIDFWEDLKKKKIISQKTKICVLRKKYLPLPGPYIYKTSQLFYDLIHNESKNCH